MSQEQHPEELLAWYVAGTLSAEEAEGVRAHVSGCEVCQREIELLSSVRNIVREPVDESVLEMAQHRFMRQLKSGKSASRPWWQPAFAAAAVLVIVVQAAVILDISRDTGEDYQLSGIKQQGIVYQIRFRDGVSEQDIRVLLQSANASIIDGPGLLGIYKVRIDDSEDNKEIKRHKDTLLSATDLIQHIEQE